MYNRSHISLSIAAITLIHASYGADTNLATIQNEQYTTRKEALASCNGPDSLHTLYQMGSGQFLLTLPQKYKNYTVPEFRDSFVKNHMIPANPVWAGYSTTWDGEGWERSFSKLKQRDSDDPYEYTMNINMVAPLLSDAKQIVKTFVAPQDISFLGRNYVTKRSGVYNRLFTYARLESVINDKWLRHVSLPLKMVIIRNKTENNNAMPYDQDTVKNMIDSNTKMGVRRPLSYLRVDYYDIPDSQEMCVLAERKVHHKNIPLQKCAIQDLVTLLKQAPFDVGYDNIFTDAQGNAIIIDTEFKGEDTANSIAKLGRYEMTEEARAELQRLLDEVNRQS